MHTSLHCSNKYIDNVGHFSELRLGWDRAPCGESIEIIIKLDKPTKLDSLKLTMDTEEAKGMIAKLKQYIKANEQHAKKRKACQIPTNKEDAETIN